MAVAALALSVATGPREAAGLDLETSLRQVAEANPALVAREAMVEAARRRIAPAGAWSSPILEVGATNVPTSGRFDEEPMTMKMVGLAQRVPFFGTRGLARRAAKAGWEAEAAAADLAGFEVLGMAWESYATASLAGERARQARAHQGVMDRLVQSARARYESGRGRLDDVLRAEAERARTLADLAMFAAEERSGRARLDALRGVGAGAGQDEALDPMPEVRVPESAGPWLEAVSETHPRLREWTARAASTRFSARAARRMTWPDFELRASYGARGTLADGTALDDMFSVTVGVMLPVFAPARELAMGAEMDAMTRASESMLRAEALDLAAAVATLHAEALAGRRTVALLADTVLPAQRRALEASWSGYTAGTTDLWRTLEVAHAQYAEEIALARAREALAMALGKFVALTGRGDLLGVDLPVVPGRRR
jgi:outer membrane protein TolC